MSDEREQERAFIGMSLSRLDTPARFDAERSVRELLAQNLELVSSNSAHASIHSPLRRRRADGAYAPRWDLRTMRKRALISGISGMVGSHLADLLLSKGYEVHGTIRRTSNLWRLAPVERLNLHVADLGDQFSMVEVLKAVQPHEVYNLAAQSFVGASWGLPIMTADATAIGVARMLDAVRHACPEARFYQASSSEMFGRVRETPQNEMTAFHPRSPYGCAKAFGHHMTVNYRESYGMFAVSGICFNCEGPRRGEEFVTRKVTMAAARIRAELDAGKSPEKLRLGCLEACRDWGFAGDYVVAMWQMLQAAEPQDYVIATGETHSIRDLCQEAFRAVRLGWEEWVQKDPSLLRPAEVDVLVGDAGKAARELGWRATMKFPELVAMMVDTDLWRIRQ